MKTKILASLISFIFLFTLHANILYAVSQEMTEASEVIEDRQNERMAKGETQDEERIDTEEKIKYQGELYTDLPTKNKVLTKPDDNKIPVCGWAVSNDAQASLRLLVDGKVLKDGMTRFVRGDMEDSELAKPYGGRKTTPKAGFIEEVDISSWSVGNHVIRVEERSRFDDLINAFEVVVNVKNRKYQGELYTDLPTKNKVLTKPDDNKIAVCGWAVSNDAQASLRLLVDGKVLKDGMTRFVRGDMEDSELAKPYGGRKTTPKAGFIEEVDISTWSVGNHVIRVEERSRFDDLINAFEVVVNVKNRQYQGELYTDLPTKNKVLTKPDDNKIPVCGWAVSNDAQANLRLVVDGKVLKDGMTRFVRGDMEDSELAKPYGGKNTTPKAGFIEEVDISTWSVGNHIIRVEERSRFDDLINAFEVVVNVKNRQYQGELYTDLPTKNKVLTKPDDNKIPVCGWAVSNDAQANLRLVVDGKVLKDGMTRFVRGDMEDSELAKPYGGRKTTPKAGFIEEVDISSWSVGNHVIRVEERSRFDDLINAFEVVVNVKNRQYQGELYTDLPTKNKVLTKPDDNKIAVCGWAVSNDAEANLRLLVDGKVLKDGMTRFVRGDMEDSELAKPYGGRKTTPKAGFIEEVDISSWSVGNHVIRVEERSRFDDLINAFEVVVNVKNRQYQGDLYVDFPTFHQVYQQGENMHVSGWAVAQDEQANIEIYVDNILKAKADRFERPDMDGYKNFYGGKTRMVGFMKNINTSGMQDGAHTLTVYQKSRYGDIIKGMSVQFLVEGDKKTQGAKGIDVSQYQGTINWKSVTNSDVKYAMIRIGYRDYGNGALAEDPKFRENFAGAVANGLKVGVYFYSTAINTTEARKDAEYVMTLLRKYGYQNKVSMPIALDLELISGVNTRDKNVSRSMRTSIANTFGGVIAGYGYTPMIYACKSFLNNNMNASQILYDVWVAQYNTKCTYTGKYTIWQYTSSGRIPGINGNVDCNICYKNY